MSADDLSRRARALRKPLSAAMDAGFFLTEGEEKLGMGDNNIVVSEGRIEVNNEDPAVGGKIESGGSDLKFGGNLKTDLKVDHLVYSGNKVLNPQIQYRPQNVVSYYPTTLTLPPGIAGGLLKGALSLIIGIVKKISESESAE